MHLAIILYVHCMHVCLETASVAKTASNGARVNDVHAVQSITISYIRVHGEALRPLRNSINALGRGTLQNEKLLKSPSALI